MSVEGPSRIPTRRKAKRMAPAATAQAQSVSRSYERQFILARLAYAGELGAGPGPMTGGMRGANITDQPARHVDSELLPNACNPKGARPMTMNNPCDENQARGPRLLMAMELGRRQWKLGFTIGEGQRSRRRTMAMDAWRRLPDEIAAAKARFDLPADAPARRRYTHWVLPGPRAWPKWYGRPR
jgi:hypothetical protein